jgi:hypothetical protein
MRRYVHHARARSCACAHAEMHTQVLQKLSDELGLPFIAIELSSPPQATLHVLPEVPHRRWYAVSAEPPMDYHGLREELDAVKQQVISVQHS